MSDATGPGERGPRLAELDALIAAAEAVERRRNARGASRQTSAPQQQEAAE